MTDPTGQGLDEADVDERWTATSVPATGRIDAGMVVVPLVSHG